MKAIRGLVRVWKKSQQQQSTRSDDNSSDDGFLDFMIREVSFIILCALLLKLTIPNSFNHPYSHYSID